LLFNVNEVPIEIPYSNKHPKRAIVMK